MISPGTIVAVAPQQLACDLAGEAVILSLATGVYYGLDAVGARIWQLIQEPKPVHAVRDAIVEEYAVTPDRCERDLLALLERLADEGLIEVTNGAGA